MEIIKISISKEKYTELRNWFTNYVNTFNNSNHKIQQNIDLKKDHTLRVCVEIFEIGKQIGLSIDELYLAAIIALLHDIGRFEQLARYNTFMDSKSENHALLGVKIINQYALLDKYNDDIKEIILRSVEYHNLAVLPKDESDAVLFFAKLIRDADKLDILKVVIDYYTKRNFSDNESIGLNLPDTPGFSDSIVQNILKGEIVDMKYMKNLNDFKLLQVSWVMDINFQPTLNLIKERCYINKIREVLPESDKLDKIFDVIYASLK